ncbi:MAG TPA: L-glutamate gamma-semialdehyde dehydrogenase [Candidatus Dorea intestinavium]|nr:L-glutamate gamma-semialdehyde dehydrogenase [Candidatus Dorea intestinavium]
MKFYNEKELDFSKEEQVKELQKAFAKVDELKGKTYPLVINDEKIITTETIRSINPAKKEEIIGLISAADEALANKAIQASAKAFQTWSKTAAMERISKVLRLNEILKENRYELITWMVEENGKNWQEADGEICELLDFNLAYACAMEELEQGITYLEKAETEDRLCKYIPIGVGIAISPWNFPLSLIGGMVVSALITGNTIVMKPSSETAIVAYKFFELVKEAGFPTGTVNFITGSGTKIGDALVSHPLTRFVNFTGSKKVGLHINELAAKTGPGQIWLKRVVAEMGGKNAIIIDKSADIAKAVTGVISSSFTLQGQKCSACSRVIVQEEILEQFVTSLIKQTKDLRAGTGRENAEVGPVISQQAYDKITQYIEDGKVNDELLCGGDYDNQKGYFIKPTVFKVTKESKIAREEIFGPVLGVLTYHDFAEAIELVNSTEYALTGSLYTKDKEQMEIAKREFHVGNLYLNRKSTGAVVHQHPFGGFNMSGTDAKTGTVDYLQNFLQLKTICQVYE